MSKRRRRRAHGGGLLVPPKTPSGTWGIRWRQGKCRHYKGGFTTKEMAEKVLAKLVGEIATGRAGPSPDTRNMPTLG